MAPATCTPPAAWASRSTCRRSGPSPITARASGRALIDRARANPSISVRGRFSGCSRPTASTREASSGAPQASSMRRRSSGSLLAGEKRPASIPNGTAVGRQTPNASSRCASQALAATVTS